MLLRPFLDNLYGIPNDLACIINHVAQLVAFYRINKWATITIAVCLPISVTHPVPFFDKFHRVHAHTPAPFGLKITTMFGNGALFLLPPNFSRPRTNRVSTFGCL